MTTNRRPLVIVAEDDSSIRTMLGHILGDFADVRLCSSGEEALAMIQKETNAPDLLVSDVMMPGIDGLTLAKRLKSDLRYAKMPVIFLTARGESKSVIAGIQAGARHYLTKPFKTQDVADRVRQVLNIKTAKA